MAPHAIEPTIPEIKDVAQPKKDSLPLPPKSRARLEKAGIDLSGGYPYRPARPLYLDDVYNIRNEDRPFTDAGSRADPEKKELLGAAKEVIHLTRHVGTEIVGLQLKDLNDKQKDELALLIGERSVVFFRDQDISPQQQKALGEHFGEIEIHVRNDNQFYENYGNTNLKTQPQVPQVPGVPGVSVIWPALQATEYSAHFRKPGGASRWHTDLVHEKQPAGITHLHNDTIPSLGGDTLWASGYGTETHYTVQKSVTDLMIGAYEKLSPEFRKFIDGKTAIYRSAHPYLDRKNPEAGPKFIEREHPLVRTHPATGWKAYG